jgi:hypothetical protein
MSVESKIKELLERVNVKASLEEAEQMGAAGVSKDSSISPKNSGDSSSPKQGDSGDASYEERNEKDVNQGAIVSKGISKNTIAMKAPVGDAPNFTTVQDLSSIPMNSGIHEEEEVEESQLDELSKSTLKSYVRKAGDQAADSKQELDNLKRSPDAGDRAMARDAGKTYVKRTIGVHQAANKLREDEYREDDSLVDDENFVEDSFEVAEETMNLDISAIFGDDLSEEFRQKATSIFEAAVIAKVNDEMDRVTQALEEKYSAEFEEYKESIVEKVDAYLNYVVENYMEENKLAIENGLRTEIAEDFITGLKALFKEHYIEVPEEKYDVIGELQSKVTELEEGLNRQLEQNVSLNAEVYALRKDSIISEMSKDLADTDAKRLAKLLEGVDFDNENLYKEKVAVIKENYFSVKETKKPSQMMAQPLVEETNVQESFDSNDTVSSYAKALSRTIKRV